MTRRGTLAALLAAVALMGAPAAAQTDVAPAYTIQVETRLGIVESRIGRLETDVNRLAGVPTALARIEEKVTALSERNGALSNTWGTITTGVIMALVGGGIGRLYQARKDAPPPSGGAGGATAARHT